MINYKLCLCGNDLHLYTKLENNSLKFEGVYSKVDFINYLDTLLNSKYSLEKMNLIYDTINFCYLLKIKTIAFEEDDSYKEEEALYEFDKRLSVDQEYMMKIIPRVNKYNAELKNELTENIAKRKFSSANIKKRLGLNS